MLLIKFFNVLSTIWMIAIFYPSIAIFVKRFHDLDYTGACYFLLFIPIVNIYFYIKLYFVKGSEGPNKYGSDPLQH